MPAAWGIRPTLSDVYDIELPSMATRRYRNAQQRDAATSVSGPLATCADALAAKRSRPCLGIVAFFLVAAGLFASGGMRRGREVAAVPTRPSPPLPAGRVGSMAGSSVCSGTVLIPLHTDPAAHLQPGESCSGELK